MEHHGGGLPPLPSTPPIPHPHALPHPHPSAHHPAHPHAAHPHPHSHPHAHSPHPGTTFVPAPVSGPSGPATPGPTLPPIQSMLAEQPPQSQPMQQLPPHHVMDDNPHVPDTEQNAQWDYVSQSADNAAQDPYLANRRGSSGMQPSNSSVINAQTPRRKMGQDLVSYPTVTHPVAFAIWVTQQLYNIYNNNVQSYSFVNSDMSSMPGDTALKRKGDQKARKLRNRQKNWVKNKENDARASLTVKARGIYGTQSSPEKTAWVDAELHARIGRTMDRYVLKISPVASRKTTFQYGFGEMFFEPHFGNNYPPDIVEAGRLLTGPLPALLGGGERYLERAAAALSQALAVSDLRPFDEALRALSNSAEVMEAAVAAISVLYSMESNFVPLPKIEHMGQERPIGYGHHEGYSDIMDSPRASGPIQPQPARAPSKKSATPSRVSTPVTNYSHPPVANAFQPVNVEPATPVPKIDAPTPQPSSGPRSVNLKALETPLTERTDTTMDTVMTDSSERYQTPETASKKRSARFIEEPVVEASSAVETSPLKEAPNKANAKAAILVKSAEEEAADEKELEKLYSAETMKLARNLIRAAMEIVAEQTDVPARASKRRKTGKSALSQVFNAPSSESPYPSVENGSATEANGNEANGLNEFGVYDPAVREKAIAHGEPLVNTIISTEQSRQIQEAYQNQPKDDEVADIDAQAAGQGQNLTHAHIVRPYTDAYGWEHTGMVNSHGEELSKVPPTYKYAEEGGPTIESAQSVEKSTAYGYPPGPGTGPDSNSPAPFEQEDPDMERYKPRVRAAAWERGIPVKGKFDLKEVESQVYNWDQARAQESTNGHGNGRGRDRSSGYSDISNGSDADNDTTPQSKSGAGAPGFINTNQDNFHSNRAKNRRKRFVESPLPGTSTETPSEVAANESRGEDGAAEGTTS